MPLKPALRGLFMISVFVVLSCSGKTPKVISRIDHSPTYSIISIRSRAVDSGMLDRGRIIDLHVMLPASYAADTERRYPVVYCLHGFGDSAIGIVTPLERAARSSPSAEAIFVGISGTNSLGGSFYANSPVIGNWADLVTEEVVALMDARFRTVAAAEGRVLAGFSMGGFGAWNLALARPDVFSGAWACGPGAWDQNGLKDTLAVWGDTYRNAYGAAYSPDPSLPPPHARIPRLDGSSSDASIISDWEKGFGGIDDKLAAYRAGEYRLKAMSFAYGTHDDYSWIPRGAAHVAARMREAGIDVDETAYPATHRLTATMIQGSFLPFLQKAFGAR